GGARVLDGGLAPQRGDAGGHERCDRVYLVEGEEGGQMEERGVGGVGGGRLQEGVGAPRVEKGAAPRRLHRHDVRKRRRDVEADPDAGKVDLELLRLLDQIAAVVVVAHVADAVKGEGGLHVGEIDEDVVGAPAAA